MILIPSLDLYLQQCTELRGEKFVMQDYKYLVDYALIAFGTAYGSDYTFSLNEWTTWESNTRGRQCGLHIMSVSEKWRQTQVNTEDSQATREILECNVVHMKLIVGSCTPLL